MTVVSVYNHTARRFMAGQNLAANTYRLMLCSAVTFNAANTTLASVTRTEIAGANGYTTGGQALTGVAITTVSTSGARFDADDVIWTASGGSIAAEFAILFNDSDADDAPLLFIDFEEVKTAADGIDFLVGWSASGIFSSALAA
jgi:hypothetical protein